MTALRGLGDIRRRQFRFNEAAGYYQRALQIDGSDAGAHIGLAQALRGQRNYSGAQTEIAAALAADPENLQARVLEAQLLGDTGNEADAQKKLDALVDSLPAQPPVESWLVLAQAFTGLGNYDTALEILKTAQTSYPNEPIVPRRVGETLTAAKRYDEALAQFDKVIAADPQDADARLDRARVFNYSDRLALAEPAYRETLQVEPDNYQAKVELADIVTRRNRWPEAIGLYREAIAQNPNDLGVRVELARVTRYNRQYDDAGNILDQVLQADANYAPALTERGILRGQQADYGPALVDLRRALELTPDDLTAQLGLAEVLGYSGDYDESIRLYRAALQRDATNQKARIELAQVLSYRRNYNDALTEINRVIAQNPQNGGARLAKADITARSGEAKAAITQYRAILASEPANRRAQLGLAEAYVYDGQYDNSLRLYDALIAADPTNRAYRVAKGRTLGYAARYPQALRVLRPLVQAAPNDTTARYALAEVLTNSGDPTMRREAIAQYQTILRQQPTNSQASVGIGRAYSYNGNYDAARTQLQNVLKSSPQNEEARLALADNERFAGKPFDARDQYRDILKTAPQSEGAKAGLRSVFRDTSPSATVGYRTYSDSNGVRIRSLLFGPTLRTRAGTFGLTGESGTFRDDGVTLRRRAINALLARNFGTLQARLLINRVTYSDAPSRTLFDLLLQRQPNSRERVFFNVGRREIVESLGAVQRGITANEYRAGIDRPLGSRVDASLAASILRYSDSNRRTTADAALYYRLAATDPTFRIGLGYRFDNTRFVSPFYYSPQSYNALTALADYTVNRDRYNYGLSLGVPLTGRGGNNNRAASTLFGFANYDISEAVQLFVNGGIVRSSDFNSRDLNFGTTVWF